MLRSTLIAALAAPLLVQGATAQEAEPEIGEEVEMGQEMDQEIGEEAAQEINEVIVQQQARSEVRGDWVLGSRVHTPDGVSIGSIDDLIIEEDGTVNAAIISVGGFLGFGAKQIAVAWSELQLDYDANEVTLPITRQEAEDAPPYAFRTREQPPTPEIDTGTGMGTDGTGMGVAN